MAQRFVSDKDIRRELKAVQKKQGQGKLAKQLKVSQTQLSQFLSGWRPHASVPMLKRMGYDPTRYYRLNDGG